MLTDGPPQALSMIESDAAYHPDAAVIGGRLRITFEGEEQYDVVAYDVLRNMLKRYARDAEGKFILRNDSVLIECKRGKVEVAWR